MLNRVILMGRLTADPELRQTQSGLSVLSFSIAVERDFTPKGEEKQVDFINLVAWRHTAEFISKYFTKGKMIAVDGRLQVRNYTDSNGNNRTIAEVLIDKAYFAGGDNNANKGQSITIDDVGDFEEIDDEDLPF